MKNYRVILFYIYFHLFIYLKNYISKLIASFKRDGIHINIFYN